MLNPWRVCSSNPARDFSSMSSTYHSAMPCLTRRVSTRVARVPRGSVVPPGSSAANNGTRAFQGMLDGHAVVGASGDAIDGLADHRVEPAVRMRYLVQQVLDAAVAAYRDGELLVRSAATAGSDICAPGFDVVEEHHDRCVVRQRRPRGTQLPWNGDRRILYIIGRCPAYERRPHQTIR